MAYRAPVTQVNIGGLSIPGLLLEDGSFAVAVPQIANQFQFDQGQASRTIKRLLGKGFQFDRTASDLHPKAVNVLSLVDFERLLAKLDRAGNKKAQDFRDSLVGLSLHQLFSDAFGIKFEAEERQQWLTERQQTRKQHQPCVTFHWAKVDGITHGGEYASRTVFLKIAAGIPSTTKVDEMTTEQLRKWSSAQQQYGNVRELGLNHKQAIEFVKTKAVLV